jgi:GT2 family glycosyltransferase
MTELPDVSVLIPTYERRDSVLHALEALRLQDLSADSFEVIVSIDGSTDGTREAVASFRAPFELRLVEGPRRGRAAACNAALDAALGEVIVILDDDMEPAPACLSNHHRHHPRQSRVCVMGAVPVRVDPRNPRVARYVAWKFDAHLAKLERPDHVFTLRDFYSGNTSIRRDVLSEVGAFDPAFTLYGNEDLELSLRFRPANVTLRYDREAMAYQHYTKTFAELIRDTIEKGRTAVLLARAHPDAFPSLQLAQYGSYAPVWRVTRGALLAATRRQPRTADAVLRVARWLEAAGAWRRPYFYVFALDYFFWVGVAGALGDAPTSGPLATLATDLRRGPVRLLLHR